MEIKDILFFSITRRTAFILNIIHNIFNLFHMYKVNDMSSLVLARLQLRVVEPKALF